MPGPSEYESERNVSLLQPQPRAITRGDALVLMPATPAAGVVYQVAVLSAIRRNRLNRSGIVRGFDSDSMPAEVSSRLRSAEIIIADLTGPNPDVLYALGLAHGLGRCPLLFAHANTDLPFHLADFNCLRYADTPASFWQLRDDLDRAVRVSLETSRKNQ